MDSARRVIPVLWALVATAVLGGCEEPPGATPNEPGEQADLREYAHALATADRFCHLWREGDFDAARNLLDPRLIKKHPESLIRGVLSQNGNPVHQAYEIHEGRRLPDGRYLFNVRLFFLYRGQDVDRLESPRGEIVLQATDDGRWLVRSFPLLP
jgi:hypothetical protein